MMFFKDLEVKDISDMPILSLAYIGDAVYELYVREHLFAKGSFLPNALHLNTVKKVNAASQKASLEKIIPLLDEHEMNYVHRGRNAKSKSKPKNADAADHNHATSLEALIGYLYVSKKYERLDYLLGIMLED
jgi:ribonuclease-3 family protein